MRMYKVFQKISTKVYNLVEFHSFQVDVAESMVLLEMGFLPLVFAIMTHLPYHLIEELMWPSCFAMDVFSRKVHEKCQLQKDM
jgi:hypothetical protein